jgi:hypothetical protein
MLENGVRVTRLDRAPDLRESTEPGRPDRKPHAPKRRDKPQRAPFAAASGQTHPAPDQEPKRRPDQPAADRPKTFAKKPWGKKPGKSRPATDASGKPGRKPKG